MSAESPIIASSNLLSELMAQKAQAVRERLDQLAPAEAAIQQTNQEFANIQGRSIFDPSLLQQLPNARNQQEAALIRANAAQQAINALNAPSLQEESFGHALAKGVSRLANVPVDAANTITGGAFGLDARQADVHALPTAVGVHNTNNLQAAIAQNAANRDSAAKNFQEGNYLKSLWDTTKFAAGVTMAAPGDVANIAAESLPMSVATGLATLNPITGAIGLTAAANSAGADQLASAYQQRLENNGNKFVPTTAEQAKGMEELALAAGTVDTIGDVLSGKLLGSAGKAIGGTVLGKTTGNAVKDSNIGKLALGAGNVGLETLQEGITEGTSNAITAYNARNSMGESLTDKDYQKIAESAGLGMAAGGMTQASVEGAHAGLLGAKAGASKLLNKVNAIQEHRAEEKQAESVKDAVISNFLKELGHEVDPNIKPSDVFKEIAKSWSQEDHATFDNKVKDYTVYTKSVNELTDKVSKGEISPADAAKALYDLNIAAIESIQGYSNATRAGMAEKAAKDPNYETSEDFANDVNKDKLGAQLLGLLNPLGRRTKIMDALAALDSKDPSTNRVEEFMAAFNAAKNPEAAAKSTIDESVLNQTDENAVKTAATNSDDILSEDFNATAENTVTTKDADTSRTKNKEAEAEQAAAKSVSDSFVRNDPNNTTEDTLANSAEASTAVQTPVDKLMTATNSAINDNEATLNEAQRGSLRKIGDEINTTLERIRQARERGIELVGQVDYLNRVASRLSKYAEKVPALQTIMSEIKTQLSDLNSANKTDLVNHTNEKINVALNETLKTALEQLGVLASKDASAMDSLVQPAEVTKSKNSAEATAMVNRANLAGISADKLNELGAAIDADPKNAKQLIHAFMLENKVTSRDAIARHNTVSNPIEHRLKLAELTKLYREVMNKLTEGKHITTAQGKNAVTYLKSVSTRQVNTYASSVNAKKDAPRRSSGKSKVKTVATTKLGNFNGEENEHKLISSPKAYEDHALKQVDSETIPAAANDKTRLVKTIQQTHSLLTSMISTAATFFNKNVEQAFKAAQKNNNNPGDFRTAAVANTQLLAGIMHVTDSGEVTVAPKVAEVMAAAVMQAITIRKNDAVSALAALGMIPPTGEITSAQAAKAKQMFEANGIDLTVTTQNNLGQSIGSQVLSALGTQLDTSKATPDDKAKLASMIGHVALQVAEQNGLVKLGTMDANTYNTIAKDFSFNTNKYGVKTVVLTAAGKDHKTSAARVSDGFFKAILGEASFVTSVRTSKVSEETPVRIKLHDGMGLSDVIRAKLSQAVNILRGQKWYVNEALSAQFREQFKTAEGKAAFLANHLLHNTPKTLGLMMDTVKGVDNIQQYLTSGILAYLNSDPRNRNLSGIFGQAAKSNDGKSYTFNANEPYYLNSFYKDDFVYALEGLLQDLDTLNTFLESHESRKQDSKSGKLDYYFDYFIGGNGRFNMASSGINPQGSSIHRLFLMPKTVVAKNSYSSSDTATNVYNHVIAHMIYGIDEKSSSEQINVAIESVKGLVNDLRDMHGKKDPNATQRIEEVKSNLPTGSVAALGLEYLSNLVEGKPFAWEHILDVDAKTSGSALNAAIWGSSPITLLNSNVAFLTENSDANTNGDIQSKRGPNAPDTYISNIPSMYVEGASTEATILGKLNIKLKDLRNVLKNPTTQENYSAQQKSLMRGLTDRMSEVMISKIIQLHKDGLLPDTKIQKTVESKVLVGDSKGTPLTIQGTSGQEAQVLGLLSGLYTVRNGNLHINFDGINTFATKFAADAYAQMKANSEHSEKYRSMFATAQQVANVAFDAMRKTLANNAAFIKEHGDSSIIPGSIRAFELATERLNNLVPKYYRTRKDDNLLNVPFVNPTGKTSNVNTQVNTIDNAGSRIVAVDTHINDALLFAEGIITTEGKSKHAGNGGLLTLHDNLATTNVLLALDAAQAVNKAFMTNTHQHNPLLESLDQLNALMQAYKQAFPLGNLSNLIAQIKSTSPTALQDILGFTNNLPDSLTRKEIKPDGSTSRKAHFTDVSLTNFFRELAEQAQEVIDNKNIARQYTILSSNYAGAIDVAVKINSNTLPELDAVNPNDYTGLFAKGSLTITPNEANAALRIEEIENNRLNSSDISSKDASKLEKAATNLSTSTVVDAHTLGQTTSMLDMMDNVSLNQQERMDLQTVLSSIISPFLANGNKLEVTVGETAHTSNIGFSKGNRVSVFKAKFSQIKQSLQEIFVHESVHSALFNALENNHEYVAAVNEMIHSVKAHYGFDKNKMASIFRPMVSNNAQALDLVNYVFFNPGFVNNTSKSVHEFMAYALTNPHLISVLKQVPVVNEKHSDVHLLPNTNWFNKLVNTVYNGIMNFLYDRPNAKGKNVHEAAMNLAKTIVNQQQATANLFERAIQKLDSVGESILDKGIIAKFKAAGEYSAKYSDIPLSPANRKEFATLLTFNYKHLQNILGHKDVDVNTLQAEYEAKLKTGKDFIYEAAKLTRVDADSSFGQTIQRLFDASPTLQTIELLHSKYKSTVEYMRHAQKVAVIKGLQSSFTKALDPVESAAATRSILATDLASLVSLFGKQSITQIKELMFNSAARQRKIAELEKSLGLNDSIGKLIKTQAQGLGQHMITSTTNVYNQMQSVPQIAAGRWTNESASKLVRQRLASPEARKQLDALITLYSLNTLNTEHPSALQTMKNVVKRENNGFKALVDMAYSNKENARSTIFKNDEMHMQKGYYSTNYSRSVDVKLIDVKDIEAFKRDGYEVAQSGMTDDVVGGTRALVFRRSAHTSQVIAGMLGSQSKHRDGTTFYEAALASNAALTPKQAKAMVYTTAANHRNNSGKVSSSRVYAIPVTDPKGNIVNYRYMLSEAQQENVLGKDYDVIKALASDSATQVSKINSVAISAKVLNTLAGLANTLPANELIWFSRDSEEYQNLPYEIKAKADVLFGGKGIPVPKGQVDYVFNHTQLSVSDSYAMTYLQRKFPDKPIKYWASFAEQIIQQIAARAKYNIVIGTFDVVRDNVLSNLVYLLMRGIPLTSAMRYMVDGVKFINDYEKHLQQVMFLKTQTTRLTGKALTDAQFEINRLESLLNSNPATQLVNAGVFTSITDDIDLDQYDLLDQFTDSMSKFNVVRKLTPPAVRTTFNWTMMTKDTPLMKLMANVTRYSDFAARYAIIQHELQKNSKLPADQRRSIQDIEYDAIRSLVNYNAPKGRGLEYLEKMGLVLFSAFTINTQLVDRHLITKNLGSTATVMGVDQVAFDGGLPDVLAASLFTKDFSQLFSDPVNNFVTAVTPGLYRNLF